ncbi:MAG: zinc metallopeptidase [Gloeobacterales cyanobacterium]
MYFGPGWWLLIPGMLLMFWAQMQIKSTYGRYSQVASSLGVTGAQVARQILDSHGLHDIAVEAVPGELSDHYDPSAKAVCLSEGNYYSNSVAAVAVAAHECGHALQDAKGYWPMNVRAALVPAANIGSSIGPMLVMAGIFFSSFSFLVNIGILLFAAAFLFHVVTLPVEFDASSRALKLVDGEMLQGEENQGARRVLNAAAWTYVATTLYSLLQLVQLLMLRDNR